MNYLIGNAQVITVDSQRRVLRDGAVATSGDRIVAVGKTEDLKSRYSDYTFVDARNRIVMPGLINAHVHLTQALIKGCADDVELMDFLQFRVWKLMGSYTPDDAAVSARLCILEMLKSGTTTFAETLLAEHYGLEGITDVVVASGIRGFLAKSVMDLPSYASRDNIMDPGMIEDGEECLASARRWKARRENDGGGRVRIWLGPRPVGSISRQMLEKVSSEAERSDMGIAIHFCEVPEDVKLIRQRYGMQPGEFMESVGIFTPRTLLAHGIWLGEDDMKRIASHKTTVVHCPASNAKLASGICPVPELLDKGVNVALGTDASTCENSCDMFGAMKLAAIIHKARTLSPTTVPAERVIEMATINGARALGMEGEIGSLEVGKKADLITVRCDSARTAPNTNPVSAVVYSATGSDVDNVMIDGEWVVRDGTVRTMDEEAIIRDSREAIARVLDKTGVSNEPQWPVY